MAICRVYLAELLDCINELVLALQLPSFFLSVYC